MKMERLTDIINRDLDEIFYHYRDLTYPLTIQGGSGSVTVMASLQADTAEMDGSTEPINAYSLTVFCLEKDLTEPIKKCISANAIIYLNQIAHKVVDTTVDMGRLRRIAVKKQGARGSITPRPLGGE